MDPIYLYDTLLLGRDIFPGFVDLLLKVYKRFIFYMDQNTEFNIFKANTVAFLCKKKLNFAETNIKIRIL